MRSDRNANQLRAIDLEVGVNRYAEGSALVRWGHTHVLATLTIDKRLPPHLRGRNHPEGWLTAEYALLPRATQQRTQRERLYASGRTQEIQRFIGRALRTVVHLEHFRNHTLILDVDVLQADGGTRCAGVLAGYAALHQAANRLVLDGTLAEWPLRAELAAVSVGVVNGETRIDLEYLEDVGAEVDLNVVATGDGRVVEVQGGSETAPIDAETYVTLVAAGVSAAQRVLERVRPSFA